MDKFPEKKYDLPKSNQEDINKLNMLMVNNEI
jgi:hypothetical protein